MQVTLVQAVTIRQALGEEIQQLKNTKAQVVVTLHNDFDTMINKRQTLFDTIDAQINKTPVVVPDAAQEYLPVQPIQG